MSIAKLTLFRIIVIILSLCSCTSVFGQGQIKRSHDNKKQSSVQISKPDGYVNGHGYIDLGLPSGTLWATCNIGASHPEEYGNYYAWGETVIKDKYSYKESKLGGVHIDKINGIKNYDAASYEWGSEWELPSEVELIELIKYCDFKEIAIQNVKGILLTGKNGKNIFIPKGGVCDYGENKPWGIGEKCQLWTGTANYKYHGNDYPGHPDDFYSTAFNHFAGHVKEIGPHFRGEGMTIRPILRKQ